MALSHLCWGCILQFAHLATERLFFLWPRLLIPHCKEQQLCFVCGGLCAACSLFVRATPSLCVLLFQLLKGWLSVFLLRKPSSGLWKSTMHDFFLFFFFPKKNLCFQELSHTISPNCVWLQHSWFSGSETFLSCFSERWWNLFLFKY